MTPIYLMKWYMPKEPKTMFKECIEISVTCNAIRNVEINRQNNPMQEGMATEDQSIHHDVPVKQC